MIHQISEAGYSFISLTNEEKIRHKCFIHRLLAIQYLPNPHNKAEVDHIDRNQANNNLNNLRWATKGENRNNRETKGSLTSWVDNKNGITYYKANYNIALGILKQKSSKFKEVVEKWLIEIKLKYPRHNLEDNQKELIINEDDFKRDIHLQSEEEKIENKKKAILKYKGNNKEKINQQKRERDKNRTPEQREIYLLNRREKYHAKKQVL